MYIKNINVFIFCLFIQIYSYSNELNKNLTPNNKVEEDNNTSNKNDSIYDKLTFENSEIITTSNFNEETIDIKDIKSQDKIKNEKDKEIK